MAAPSEDAVALANSTRTLAVGAVPSENAAAFAERKMITVVAVPSEDAAAPANSTRTLAVGAVPSEHAAALAESKMNLVVAIPSEHAAAVANSTSMCHSGGSTIIRSVQQHLLRVRGL